MRPRLARLATLTILVFLLMTSAALAQTIAWGVKAGVNRTSVPQVAKYYDWLLCCLPRDPNALVTPASGTGGMAGVFGDVAIRSWFGITGELSVARQRHSVNFRPYEALDATFTRDYLQAGVLAKAEFSIATRQHVYVTGGPSFGFKVGEGFASIPTVKRGDPETDIYIVQAVMYGVPEVLRTRQTSLVLAGGWTFNHFLVEIRYTRALQSMFKDREGLVDAFVALGGHEPTVRFIVPLFAPFLEAAKSRDIAVLAGWRF